ncbi:hypothetical protein [Rhodococcus sp. ZPP]|uniref:hypothetical protein n=1 Tax=Rhodococcus sp. ZPP TaxID=2749906 RepID=UPI001FCBE6D9|nr:hypothetical protein [Rhodococcus sp. ZPP]
MELAVIGREDLTVHIEWNQGEIISWTPGKFDEDDRWIVLNSDSLRGSGPPTVSRKVENA